MSFEENMRKRFRDEAESRWSMQWQVPTRYKNSQQDYILDFIAESMDAMEQHLYEVVCYQAPDET